MNHLIVNMEQDAAGKVKRKNCKLCYLKEKKELKVSTMCEKCKAALHVGCFKEGIVQILIYFSEKVTFLSNKFRKYNFFNFFLNFFDVFSI